MSLEEIHVAINPSDYPGDSEALVRLDQGDDAILLTRQQTVELARKLWPLLSTAEKKKSLGYK